MSDPICSFEDCEDQAQQRGLCWGHLAQLHQKGALSPKRGTRPRRICQFPECGRPHAANGWCHPHRWQEKRGGEMWPVGQRVKKHRTVTRDGYVKILAPEHPNAQSSGWLLEHVSVVAEDLGRPLLRNENVHHINGVRDDNRLENLELWSTSQPKGQRVDDKVVWAIHLLETYQPDILRTQEH